jgi:hypothetical protein
VNALGVLAFVGFLCEAPALRENVSNRAGKGFVLFTSVDCIKILYVVEEQMPLVESVGSRKLNRATAILSEKFRRTYV